MIVSLLVAMDEKQGIGLRGALPWHLSSDLRRFKALTMGHHVIMGRKTWESIGRVLPGRTMIIISRNPDYEAEGCLVVQSLEDALHIPRLAGEDEAFIIGGGEIFQQALPLADKIYLTRVKSMIEADAYFPSFDPSEWTVVHRQVFPAGEKDQYATEFQLLVRSSDRPADPEDQPGSPYLKM